MRTSLAVKIFLSFWLIHAVIFIVLGLAPDPGATAMVVDRVRYASQLAASLLERDGNDACARFLHAAEETTASKTVLFDEGDRPLCRLGPVTDDSTYGQLVAQAKPDGTVKSAGGRLSAAVTFRSSSGRGYKAAWIGPASASSGNPPPVPYGFLGTAVIVSGIVCFLLARNLVSPLQRMRAATHRLREGDLSARAAAGFEQRTDEIGDVVSDFDAMAERIESLVRAQQQLLSDISHELRSPLARLNVALELARRTSSGDADTHFARIESEAEQMNEMIGRLLALARAEAARPASHAEAFDLEDVVRRVTDDANYEARGTGKTVTLSLQGKATLHGDPLLIASAVENVVRNAVQYSPLNAPVEVTAAISSDAARIVVRDHGAGVPEGELEQVFEPFHRVDASRARESGGTGLGLAIAQRAVTSQGGTIKANNAEGGGLQVTITLPVVTR
jgi:two-component system, OmpR family, sensor histidine kinase CpxA